MKIDLFFTISVLAEIAWADETLDDEVGDEVPRFRDDGKLMR